MKSLTISIFLVPIVVFLVSCSNDVEESAKVYQEVLGVKNVKFETVEWIKRFDKNLLIIITALVSMQLMNIVPQINCQNGCDAFG